jgi:outer membrane protein OmpA-like peptidoglycan-associated protein
MKLANLYKTLLLVIAVAIVTASYSQFTYDYKKSADKFYAQGDYFSAAENYEKYLEQKKSAGSTTEPYTVQGKSGKKGKSITSREEIVYRIAESYRMLHYPSKAEKWYGEATAFDKTQYPLAAYWYGVSLRANGKFAEAEKNLQDFINSYKANDQYKEQAQIELADVKFIQQQMQRKDKNLYSVSAMGTNNVGADYASSFLNGNLVFTSTRADSTAVVGKNKNPHVNNLYWAASTDGVFTSAQKITLPVTDNMEQGVATFTPDGSKMFFTRWVKKEGGNLASIYMSEKQGENWTAPTLVGGKINAEGYSSQQPHVTADGKYLLFASNRPGGNGKFDLYYAPLNNGNPGSVTNFGNAINSKEDDQAPFYHQPTKTLVFATKGRVGMGGYELFETKGTIGSAWSEPKNLGYPVNSIKDDIYFSNKGTNQLLKDAAISSDRSSECCLQLFTVNKIYKKYVSGVVTDCKTNQPIASANVRVTDNNGKTVMSGTTESNGSYFFSLDEYQQLQISATKESYNDGKMQFYQPSNPEMDTMMNTALCLSPVEVVVEEPQPEPTKELKAYFDFEKYDLRPETGMLLDTLVALMKRESKLGLEIFGYTDKKGTDDYNMNLSQKRAEACKAYLVQNGIAASRLKAFAKGECCQEKPETKADGSDDEQARQANRRVEFKIVLLHL